MNKEEYNKLSSIILDCSIEVHRNLGPGLLESVYEYCLKFELEQRKISVQSQVELPLIYKKQKLEKIFKIDLLVGNEIVVELKTVEKLLPIHKAQLISYLKLSNNKLGLLINFNEVLLKNGFKRFVNNF